MEPVKEDNREDLDAIVSSRDFRLFTTLQYHFFNEHNHGDKLDTVDTVKTHHLIEQWKATSIELLGLHTRRLREAAEALGWTDVAQNLCSQRTFPISSGGDQCHRKDPEDVAQRSQSDELQQPPFDLKDLIEAAFAKHSPNLAAHEDSPLVSRNTISVRIRILISRSSEATVEFGPLLSVATTTLLQQLRFYTTCPFIQAVSDRTPSQVSLAAHSTTPSLFTRHKTTHRAMYNDARQHADPPLQPTDPPTAKELLLFNTDDQIMEASLSSVYFHRDGKWITPSARCGGVQSVTKMYALERGWCAEEVVMRSEIRDGEVIWLSNAVRGYFPGLLVFKTL